jgi:hypothetical protein
MRWRAAGDARHDAVQATLEPSPRQILGVGLSFVNGGGRCLTVGPPSGAPGAAAALGWRPLRHSVVGLSPRISIPNRLSPSPWPSPWPALHRVARRHRRRQLSRCRDGRPACPRWCGSARRRADGFRHETAIRDRGHRRGRIDRRAVRSTRRRGPENDERCDGFPGAARSGRSGADSASRTERSENRRTARSSPRVRSPARRRCGPSDGRFSESRSLSESDSRSDHPPA